MVTIIEESGETRIVLDEKDFTDLVAGRMAESAVPGFSKVKIILSDIGRAAMYNAIAHVKGRA